MIIERKVEWTNIETLSEIKMFYCTCIIILPLSFTTFPKLWNLKAAKLIKLSPSNLKKIDFYFILVDFFFSTGNRTKMYHQFTN